jgi:hypothetical protein
MTRIPQDPPPTRPEPIEPPATDADRPAPPDEDEQSREAALRPETD